MAIIDCVNRDGNRCKCQDDLIIEVEKRIDAKCMVSCLWHYPGYTERDRDKKLIEIYHEIKGNRPIDIRWDMFWCGHDACHPDDILSITYEASAIRLLVDNHDEYLSYHDYIEAVKLMKKIRFNIPKRIKRKYRRLSHNKEKYPNYYWHSSKRGKM